MESKSLSQLAADHNTRIDASRSVTSPQGSPSPQQPAAVSSPNSAAPAAPNTTPEDRRLLAQQRGHQSLGRVGDFWALVAMAASINDTREVLADLLDAKLGLEAVLRELRESNAAAELERASLSVAQAALADRTSHWEAQHVNVTAALRQRTADIDRREDDATTRENAINIRENGVTAREAKMDKDHAAAIAQLAIDRAELQEMADQLSIRKADIDTRSAALDKRLAAAKQFLALHDTQPEAADVGRMDASAASG